MKQTLTLLLGACLALVARAQSLNQLVGFPCAYPNCPYGSAPDAVILASEGTFDGVATGDPGNPPGGGAIFRFTAGGEVTLIYEFPLETTTGRFINGSSPNSIAEGRDGMLYGTAESGGNTSYSSGTVWRIHKDGTGFQVLQTLETGSAMGAYPSNIIAASDGNLYAAWSSGSLPAGPTPCYTR